MSKSEATAISVVAVVVGAIICAAIYFGVQGANEAQRTGVERQQECVEAGGSYLDVNNGQFCIRVVGE